jgi:hypothetical protein
MKRMNIIIGAVVGVLGLLVALGPQFLFKVCAPHEEGGFSHCHWSAQAEIGMGFLIVALGVCMIVLAHPKTQLGLAISVFLAGLVSLFIPHTLIGGCSMATMACQRVAFPALTIECIVLLIVSAVYMVLIELKKPSASREADASGEAGASSAA